MISACIYTTTDNGGQWTTIATGSNEKNCLTALLDFYRMQPLVHWGITEGRVIHLYDTSIGFYKRTAYSKFITL